MGSNGSAAIEELLRKSALAGSVTVDLGCGMRKHAGAIGIDRLPYAGVDLVGDVPAVLREFPSDSVDRFVSHHFVEHVEDLEDLVMSMARIVKPGGQIQIVVPHFSNPYYYSDYTHKRPFGLYSFCYFARCERSLLKRQVPQYIEIPDLRLTSVRLHFKSSRPFYLRYAIDRVCELMFNSCRMMKELYERAFCYLWPCYEVGFVLQKQARPPGNT